MTYIYRRSVSHFEAIENKAGARGMCIYNMALGASAHRVALHTFATIDNTQNTHIYIPSGAISKRAGALGAELLAKGPLPFADGE